MLVAKPQLGSFLRRIIVQFLMADFSMGKAHIDKT